MDSETAAARSAQLPRAVWAIAAAVLALHLAVAGRYDFFRNELYFIACGRHPAFGYADQPPLVPLLAAATQIFGENLVLLRLPAALAAAALVPLTAAMATLLGGGAVTAAVAVAASVGLTAVSSTFGTSTLEPIGWTGIAYLVMRAWVAGDRRALMVAGAAAGIVFQVKFGVALWVVGLLAGLAATPARTLLLTREAAIGAMLAVVIGLPPVAWQAAHGFPFRDIVAYHSAEGRIFTGGPARFVILQMAALNIVLAPLWLTGIAAPFVSARLAAARPLAIAAVIAAVTIFAARGKDYYLFPVYPALFAVGAAAAATLPSVVRAGWMALATANAAFLLPICLPVLSPDALFAYMNRYHVRPRPNEAAGVGAKITQVFSDEFPWRELAAKADAIYAGLPEDRRPRTGIFARNYGEAAAIGFFGHAPGLPRVMSGEDQYFFWGPAGDPRDLILVNADRDWWASRCGSVEEVARFGDRYAMPYETDAPIFVCHDLRQTIASIWPALRWRRAGG